MVDDNRELLKSLHEALISVGLPVTAVRHPSMALEAVRVHSSAVAVIPHQLPDISGIELMQRLHAYWRDLSVIVLNGGAENVEVEALNSGAFACLSKPCCMRKLCQTIYQALAAQVETGGVMTT